MEQFRQVIAESQEGYTDIPLGEITAAQALSISTPQGGTLMADVDLAFATGSWSKLSGRSGIGKSTLLRTLSGIWPWFGGDWQRQHGKSLLLPQKAYLGQGTLREILCYPEPADSDTDKLRQLLQLCGLGEWHTCLDQQLSWEHILSGGQKQRLAFARAIYLRPDVLWLDEATSSLDAQSADEMLSLLKSQLPDCTVIAISHQSDTDSHFSQHINLNAVTLP